MADLAADADLGRLLIDADGRGQVIAPLCHGPAALLSATREDGTFAFAGRRLTVFTDEEELQGGTGEQTPWFVEETLREKGAEIDAGPAWSSKVVVDGNLISGQNPQSSEDAAKQVLAALTRHRLTRAVLTTAPRRGGRRRSRSARRGRAGPSRRSRRCPPARSGARCGR